MKYSYFTILADGAQEFTDALDKKGAEGWRLDKFQYQEYPHRSKDKETSIIQAYVGVMVKEIDDEASDKES